MSVTLLTLDLGVTTGWAVFLERQLHDYSTITNHYDSLPTLVKTYSPDITVIEKALTPTRGELADKLERINALADYFFRPRKGTEFIFAGDWKPTPAAKEKVPRGISQHERDAIRIGYWYIRFRLQST